MVEYNSGTRVNSLLDNPCLNRGLVADFTNSRCYKQAPTTINYLYYWTELEMMDSDYYKSCSKDECLPCNDIYLGTYQIMQVVFKRFNCRCDRTISSYSCPSSHPIKLNNTTCEYREAF
ncbi:hypothetical protein [Aliarcobacter butzleri]|uniref:hypothetical protein n=1 Tax=Aliarcobacter butzleri TaxID=28197 RepID=UPI002B24FFA1|nr:hypothetical protein [Aliarcobacter butzleri]